MTDNVINMPMKTRLDVDPERIIEMAASRKFRRILIIGVQEDGSEFQASSAADGGSALWDMERCRHKLMKVADDE